MENKTIDDLPDDSSADDERIDVLIVGGGISGIQAALDLAETGFKVFLVDKSPAIGGKMAQLDKTFPTNDCSMCIESPKFIECSRHPNIEILTYTEVERVEGEAGEFTVTLIKKPRYIIEDRCTGCTTCVEYCPVKVPDPYNQNLSLNKAIHIYFSQAVPLITYVDPETCLYLQDEQCTICRGVCKHEAIDLDQKPKRLEIEVGAIILAPGYEVFDPKPRGDFGYGIMPNVVTSLDFERILCSTGPYDGEIRRPSDGKHPNNIAWIQCVGSRQVNGGGKSYCSAICCAYTQKQVILAKEHHADMQATIFHNDIRAFGKDFERFYQRAENLPDVRFIRSYVSIGREIPESKNVTLRYSTFDQGVKEEEFDMVVLSVGLAPPADALDLAQKFNIELNAHQFCMNQSTNPIETSRPGVFVSGAFQGPIDIPESVVTASGADALCSQLLAYRRGDLARERIYPPERDETNEEPKVGVFVCHCGANIGRVVDVPAVVEYASTLDNVVTSVELDSLIVNRDERLSNCENLVMIQCVGCRNEERNYCSRVCCGHSIKNALDLRAINPDMDIYILYRDMRSYGFKEDFYREAAEKNIRFVRYSRDDKLEVQAVEEGGRKMLQVAVTDHVLGKRLLLDADILQLAAAVIPSPTSTDIAKLFKVAMDPDGFFQEAHVKLRPVDSAVDGIFICGTAHYPKHITETISQAYGAAGRAVTVLIKDSVTASGAICEVNESACETCGACISLCTYGAIEFVDTPKGKKAMVNPILCKGDGLCTTRCPTGAIYLKHFTDEEILSQIDAA